MSQLRRALLAWYQRHKRDLPWRRTRDPYAIWLSETMLQQTRVEQQRQQLARDARGLRAHHRSCRACYCAAAAGCAGAVSALGSGGGPPISSIFSRTHFASHHSTGSTYVSPTKMAKCR